VTDEHPCPPEGSRGLVTDTECLDEEQLRSHRLALKVIVPLGVVLLALVVLFFVVYDTSRVEGGSMLPNLHSGDVLLITRGLPDPKRDDIVVINGYGGGQAPEIVKRIVALAGDKVVVKGDRAWVNGLDADLGYKTIATNNPLPAGEITVPAGCVYVMGDNRPVSYDSRFFGPVPVKYLHGKAMFIFAPITRFGPVSF
jgi:signal peptidase I